MDCTWHKANEPLLLFLWNVKYKFEVCIEKSNFAKEMLRHLIRTSNSFFYALLIQFSWLSFLKPNFVTEQAFVTELYLASFFNWAFYIEKLFHSDLFLEGFTLRAFLSNPFYKLFFFYKFYFYSFSLQALITKTTNAVVCHIK